MQKPHSKQRSLAELHNGQRREQHLMWWGVHLVCGRGPDPMRNAFPIHDQQTVLREAWLDNGPVRQLQVEPGVCGACSEHHMWLAKDKEGLQSQALLHNPAHTGGVF